MLLLNFTLYETPIVEVTYTCLIRSPFIVLLDFSFSSVSITALKFLTSCLSSNSKILLLEEPEKALHAQAQVHLARFFSEQSKKNQLIIETHSENLLLGMLKEIRDKRISHKEVRVIYVYMENKKSKIQDISINENGSFGEKWRDGFFTEKLDLL